MAEQRLERMVVGKNVKIGGLRNGESIGKENKGLKKEQQSYNENTISSMKSQSQSAMIPKSTSKSRIKSIAESKIKKYI